MCSYTQVVIVTHRSPVIPCQRLMFRSFVAGSYSSWIFVIIVRLCGALMLESPVATRKTSVNPSSSIILIGLQLFAIHLATVLVNLSQADLKAIYTSATPLAAQLLRGIRFGLWFPKVPQGLWVLQ